MTGLITAVALGLTAVLASAAAAFLHRRRRTARRLYREHLERALEDGVLTPDEVRHLQAFRAESALTDDEVRLVAQAIYRRALRDTVLDARVTAEEEAGLERLRLQLGLSAAEVESDSEQLRRVRLLSRIERGELPDVAAPVEVVAGERCHWVVHAQRVDSRAIPSAEGAAAGGLAFLVAGTEPFETFGQRGPVTGDSPPLPRELGLLVVTSRRTLFNAGRRSLNLPHVWLRAITLFRDGIRVEMTDGRPDQAFTVEDPELTGAMLLRAARRRQAEVIGQEGGGA